MASGRVRRSRRGVTVGVVLIVLGVIFLIQQLVNVEGGLLLSGLGAAFLLVYFVSRRLLGFVVAGAVLLALGVFASLDEANLLPRAIEGAVFFLLLGAAFLFVYLVHTRSIVLGRGRNWPLVTGLVLWGVGALILLVEHAVLLPPETWAMVLRWSPAILIAIGLWQLAQRLRESRR